MSVAIVCLECGGRVKNAGPVDPFHLFYCAACGTAYVEVFTDYDTTPTANQDSNIMTTSSTAQYAPALIG